MAVLEEQSGILDLVVDEGTDWSETFTWRDENDALIDLTSYTAKMQIRKKVCESGTPELELTDGSGITLGGVNGTIQIDITKEQNAFGDQSLVHDLELTEPGGGVLRLWRGSFTSIAEVTK